MKLYHTISSVPISSLHWEEIVVKFLMGKGYKPVWEIGSHKSGPDVYLSAKKDKGISCKSCKFPTRKEDYFIVSSYRTGKYKSLGDKVKFLREVEKQNICYLVCARSIQTLTYKVLFIDPAIFNVDKFVFDTELHQRKGNLVYRNPNGISFRITKSQSDQVWYTIPNKPELAKVITQVGIY